MIHLIKILFQRTFGKWQDFHMCINLRSVRAQLALQSSSRLQVAVRSVEEERGGVVVWYSERGLCSNPPRVHLHSHHRSVTEFWSPTTPPKEDWKTVFRISSQFLIGSSLLFDKSQDHEVTENLSVGEQILQVEENSFFFLIWIVLILIVKLILLYVLI